MSREIIADFEEWATGELRELLAAEGVDRPQWHRVKVLVEDPAERDWTMTTWSPQETARRLAELMQIPLESIVVAGEAGAADGA